MANQKTIMLGVVGDSAAGKTTLTKGIVDLLGEENVTAICSDDYHKYDRKERKEKGITALHPDCNHVDVMESHFRELREGRPILKPNYNHSTGEFDAPTYIKPAKFVIVEGLLGFHTKVLRNLFDVKVYLDPPEDVRINWKLQRDMSKRGYDRDQVINALKAREKDTKDYILPQKRYADILVSFYPQDDENDERLNAKIALSPSNPNPEFNRFIEGLAHDFKAVNGHPSLLSIELDKLNDRPVEILKVAGGIEEEQTNDLKSRFGSKICQKEIKPNLDFIGTFSKGDNSQMSYPLALVQLAIAYFMINTQLPVYQ